MRFQMSFEVENKEEAMKILQAVEAAAAISTKILDATTYQFERLVAQHG